MSKNIIPIYSDGSEESIQEAEDKLIELSRSSDGEERIQGIIGLGTFRAMCFLTNNFKDGTTHPKLILAALNMTAGLYSNIMELVPEHWEGPLATKFVEDVKLHDKIRKEKHDERYK